MGKPNYNQVKRQKEAARKARQQARLARRQSRVTDENSAPEATPGDAAGASTPDAPPTDATP